MLDNNFSSITENLSNNLESFTFDDSLFNPLNLSSTAEIVSPEYDNLLKEHANSINKFIPAVPSFNVLKNPEKLSEDDILKKELSQIGSIPSGNPKVLQPLLFSVKETNFDRYYAHPKFSKLKWHPYANNEEYYNENSTIWDDYSRMFNQFGKLTKTGFVSSYRAIGDLFSGNYLSPDLESASEFENAVKIGNSTRGGIGSFTNNLLLQFGYTTGIIGSIAAEELAIAGLTSIAPSSATITAPKFFQNLYKAGDTIADSFAVGRMAKFTRSMLQNIKTADAAKNFWRGLNGAKVAGLFLPETVKAIKTLNSTQNAYQGLTNLAKASKTFGGFYRDLRSLNYALAESKMEGGLTYNNQIANGFAIKTNLYGENLDDNHINEIIQQAERASFRTTILNAPLIYFSNQLVLGNAFGSYNKSLSRALKEVPSGIAGRVLKTSFKDKTGKIISRPFSDAGEGFSAYLKRLKNAGVKGSIKSGAHASLRYFAANFAEGIQEVSQEAISKGVEDYFNAVLENPSSENYDLLNASITSGIASQLNSQGFETFMTGFLMGGLAQLPQKMLFQSVPNIYNQITNKEEFEQFKEQKNNLVSSLVDELNNAYEQNLTNPLESIFNPIKFDLSAQENASQDMFNSINEDSVLDFIDAKDFSKFSSIYKVLNNNSVSFFREQFEDLSKLSDQELLEAFPTFKEEIQSGKMRGRFTDMINNIDLLENQFVNDKNEYVNPFNPNIYKPGTADYHTEQINFFAFEHARYLRMFTKDSFNRSLERVNSIFQNLSTNPISSKITASDITVLLNSKTLLKELKMLESEINLIDDPELKKAKKQKLNDLINLTSAFESEDIDQKNKAFTSYIKNLSQDEFVFDNKIQEAFEQILDYYTLSARASSYAKAIEYLNNPNRVKEITERTKIVYKNAFKNRLEIFKNSIKNHVTKTEQNQLLNKIHDLGIIIEPTEIQEFINTDNVDVLKSFYDENGLINEMPVNILTLINIYKESNLKTTETKETPVKQVDDFLDDILDIVEDTPPVQITNEENNPKIKEVLNNKYNKYVLKQNNLNKLPISINDWRKQKEALNYISAYKKLKALWYQTLPETNKEYNFNNDIGFDNWLESQKENITIEKIFFDTETKISDFINVKIDEENIPESSGRIVNDTFNNVQIVEKITSDDEGNFVPLYTITDKKGNLITQDDAGSYLAFTDINKAKSAAKKLDESNANTDLFTFGGMELSYGTVLIDSKNKKYLVLGTPAEVAKGKKLFLLAFEDIKEGQSKQEKNKLAKKLTESEFKNKYKKETLNFNEVTENTSRLLLDDAVSVYPYVNRSGSQFELIEEANKRLQLILENLTPEQRKNLKLIIKRNSESNKPKGKFKIGDKNPNPYINKLNEPFSIGISLESFDEINSIIINAGLKPTQENIFAFIPNQSIQFVNDKNEVINPLNITKEIIENTFTIYPKQQANAVNTIINNYAIQQAFFEQVADKMEGKDAAVIPISEFTEFGFNLGSSVDLKSNPKPVKELKYNTVDGVKVVMINDTLKNGTRSTRILTDIEDIDEREAFIKKLKQDLAASQPGLFESFQKEQRYFAIIKTPNGIYTGAPLKTRQLEKEEIFNLSRELVEEGVRTINENLDGEGSVETKKIKDKNFNVEFNQAFNKKLYITTNIEGYTVEINVNADGTFRAELYDKKGKSVVGSSYLDEGRQGTLDYQGAEKPDIIERLLDNLQKLGIDKAAEKFKEKKKKDSSVEIPEWTKLKLSINNVRASFVEDANIDTILDNTVTTLNENVRTNYKLRLTADSNVIQEVLLFAATPAVIQQENKVVIEETLTAPVSTDAKDITVKIETYEGVYEDTGETHVVTVRTMADGSKIIQEKIKGDKIPFPPERIKDDQLNLPVENFTSLSKGSLTKISEKIIDSSTTPTDAKADIETKYKREDFPDTQANTRTPVTQKLLDYFAEVLGIPKFTEDLSKGTYVSWLQNANPVGYAIAEKLNAPKQAFDIIAKHDAELAALEAKPAPIAVTTQEVTTPLKKELQQNLARIKEIETEIDTAEPDIVKASELMEDNAERQKLIARNREIQRKLLANKIVSKTLSEQEVADIDEFVIWANDNLPDFISIEDISNLRDNLVTNGVRVGAFVLSMNQIAGGMTVKGTLYTGAKSPYKYHEAFHGVFRSLLSNAQQDKLYKIAEAEVKRKLGDKFEEELGKFRNSADSYKAMSRKALEKEFYEEYMADEFEKFKKDPRSTKTDSAIKNFFNRIIEWIKSLFNRYTPNELQQLFKDIDSGKFKSASPINNRFTDSLATGITLANKIIPVEMIESETGAFGYRTLDNNFARSIVSSISARVIMLEQENKNSNFNIKKAVNDSFNRFKALYSTRREAYKTMELTPEQKRNLRDIEKAFSEFSDFIKEAVYDELKYYEIKSRKIEEDLEDTDDQVGDRLRTTDQYDKDVTSIGGFSSLSSFLRKYIGTTPISEKDQFGNDFLIDAEKDENGEDIEGTGEKLMITVDFATAYNGFLKAVKNLNDPIQILQQLYFFGINNPQTEAVVNKLFLDLGIKWADQLENGQLPQYTAKVIEKFRSGKPLTQKELRQGVKRPLLLQAVLKGFENARVDYLFIHRSTGDQVYTYTAANRDDANTQVDRWGQAYIQKSKVLNTDEGIRNLVVDTFEGLLQRLQFVKDEETSKTSVKKYDDQKLSEFAHETTKILEENLGISLSPKFIEFSVAKNIERPTRYQKALLNANADEKALNYKDIKEIKLIVEGKQDLFTADEGARNRLRKIALGNAAFDENVGASVFKNPNGDLVYAHQLPSFHLKQIAALNDVANNGSKIEELKKSDEYLVNNFLLNSEAFKQLSAEGRLRILRIAGSKTGNIDMDEDGLMSETSGRTPSSGTTYGDSTPREFILNLINSYTYAVDSVSGKVNTISWTKEDGTIEVAALAPVLLRVLEASNTGDMISLPVFKAVDKKGGKTILTEEALDAILNNVAAEFARIQKESNPETATQELHVGYNALAIPNAETGTEEIIPINVTSDSVNKARAFNFHKTGVLLSPLGQKKESRQGIVTIQTSDIKLERIEKGDQTALVYDQKAAEQFIGFTSTGVVRDAIVKTKEGDKNVPKRIIGRGLVRVTPENRERIFEDLKGSISLVQNDQFKYEVRIGTKKFYVESINEQKFLQGKKPMYMYDLMEAGEADVMEQIAGLVGGFEVEGYLNKLTEAARSPEFAGLTFAEAIQKLGIKESELKAFLQNRMDQEFAEFNITLDELVGSQGGLANFLTNGIQTAGGAVTGDAQRSGRLLNIIPEDSAYNLKQIFFNDYINTTAINQILLGDSAYSLKDAVDEIKRAKAQSASYYSAASTVAAPEYGIFKPLQEISLFELTEPIVNATYNAGEVKNADAQLWMTTKAFRHFQYGFGKLTPAQAELFDRIERGEDISAEDIFGTEESTGYAKRQEMLNSQKLVYADGKTFVKMSAFPLLPQFTSLKDSEGNYTIPKPNKVALHNLRVKLEAFEQENNTVSVAAPRSALKMMQKNVSNIHGVTGTTTPLGKNQSVTLNANYLGLQVINPSNKIVITDPTQVKTLVTSEQNDSTEVIINGEKLTLGEVRAAYHKATRDRGNLNYINKRNLVFSFDVDYAMDELQKSIKENAITADLYTYLRYAEASLASTGSSSHLMELFSLDESGNQKYNLNNPLTYDKFLNLFMSYFSKSVFNEKVPGATVSLVSDYGVRVYRRVLSVDENGMPDKHEIITEAQYEAMANKPDIAFNIDEGSYPGNDENIAGLKDAVKKSKGAGVVIIDRLRHNMKEYDSKGKATGQKYGEMLLPPHHKEVMEELQLKGKSIPDVVGKMFAVRIPSQDNHSTYNVKWVDFMPAAYGSSGVFARELIEISGADFDIDKVYMQFKEFYEKNGEFFEYGKKKTEKEQFEDYVQYVNKKVQDTDSVYGEALYKYNGRGTTNALTPEQPVGARAQGFSEEAINALSVLGMPRFYAEYSTYRKKFGHEPYAAAINNDILDYKVALMGNDHVTERKPLFLDKNGRITTVNTGKPALDENGKQKTSVAISYEAADMEVLKDLWDELKTELPEWAALSEEEGIDVDNLYGKLRMFANNKEGSRSIGAVVLPNLYLNLLQEYDVKIASTKINGEEVLPQIEFGGVTFSNFRNTFELNEDGSQGQRTQYILSALITAATDNAKERLLAKLGLNINALSVVANLTALGVPVKTSVLLVNHPVIRQAYFMEANASADKKVSVKTVVQERISALQRTFLENEERKMRTSVTQNSLMEAIETPLIKATATEGDMAELRENGEITKMQVIEEISILEQFLNAAMLSNTTRYMGDIINLTNGLGQGLEAIDKRNEAIENLGLNLSDKEFIALGNNKPMIDARPIFKGDTWQAGYLERFQEFTNFLLPKVVLSASPLFRRVTDEVVYQSTVNSLPYELRDKTKTKIARDFLSYLTIKAYMQNGLVNNSQSVATLTNGLIYNQEGVENITAVVDRLRATEEGANNYFLNSFIITEKASLKGNKTGLNLAGANTFLRYNDSQKLDIQNGFMTLYANPLTRSDAKTLVHYMMVKDGLQYGYKSIVESVAPIALDSYLSHIDTVQAAMERPNDTVFQSTFGMKLDDLVIDFMQGYLTSAPNAYVIKKVRAAIYAPETKGITIEPKVFTKALATSNPEAIYVFGDNVAKQGTVGNSSVRGLDNAFGLFFKKDMNRTESSYYTNAEAGDFITIFDEQVEQLTNMIAEGKQVIFAKDLISTSELADFKKNSPVVFEYVKAKLLQDLQYNIDPKAKKSAEEKKAARIADPAILRAPVHVNASSLVPRLVVDLYAGISRLDKTNAVSSIRNTPAASKLTKQLADTFAKNKKALSRAGFKNIINLKKGSDYHTEVEFPMVVRQNVGSEYKAEYRYYVLAKTQSLFPAENLINFNNKAIGSYAEYIQVDIKGSNAQNPIGFMFGERPTTKELKNFINSINSSDPFDVAFDSIDIDLALDNINLEKGIKISAGSSVVATEKGIQVNGENISKVSESAEFNNQNFVEPEVDETSSEDLIDLSGAIDISANSFFNDLLADTLENTYSELTEWWEINIDDPFSQTALDNRNKLKAYRNNPNIKLKVENLKDFIELFENSQFTNEQEFLDHFNNCYL
jgi:hypothetical protein